jgi:hypothetical protein
MGKPKARDNKITPYELAEVLKQILEVIQKDEKNIMNLDFELKIQMR